MYGLVHQTPRFSEHLRSTNKEEVTLPKPREVLLGMFPLERIDGPRGCVISQQYNNPYGTYIISNR